MAAGEPGPEELAPANEGHSRSIQEKESAEEKLAPVVAGEAAKSPQESPVIVKTPEARLIKDEYPNDSDGVVSQESAVQEPQESSEGDTAPAEAAFAEASPKETTEEVATAVAAGRELQRERDQPHISVSPLEASEEKRTEEEATEVGEKPPHLTPEEEKPVVFVLAEHQTEEEGQEEPAAVAPSQEAPALIIPVEFTEQESHREEQEETLPVLYTEESLAIASLVIKDNTEDDPAADQQPLPPVLEEEESVNLPSAELDDQVESAAEETAPKESAPENPDIPKEEQDKPFQEESFHIVFQEAPEEEAPEECTEVEENVGQDLDTNKELYPRTLADECLCLNLCRSHRTAKSNSPRNTYR